MNSWKIRLTISAFVSYRGCISNICIPKNISKTFTNIYIGESLKFSQKLSANVELLLWEPSILTFERRLGSKGGKSDLSEELDIFFKGLINFGVLNKSFLYFPLNNLNPLNLW